MGEAVDGVMHRSAQFLNRGIEYSIQAKGTCHHSQILDALINGAESLHRFRVSQKAQTGLDWTGRGTWHQGLDQYLIKQCPCESMMYQQCVDASKSI